ncbi:NADPH-dependent FMN reductase [Oryzifoliimicrobium ureilyticus]|uniref:NADPH-dependent FMN reductase n=1 Tax=Oryzifoliimicrobium ureilyticus TaxID=3113724 RepID=UPI0030762436
MSGKPRIAIIISSTRPTRFADLPAQWVLKQANARSDMEAEIVDLRDHPLPFFDEIASSGFAPSRGAEAIRWQQTLKRFDGFIFVLAEYNFAVTGALKNAIDHAYHEWSFKPFTAVAYGGTGGVRALENLRTIATPLQMVSTRSSVHIGGADFVSVHPGYGIKKPIEAIEDHILPSANAALDELSTWLGILRVANGRAA